MLYKVVGIELTSRPFKNDPYEPDSHVIDKSYGTVGVILRPLAASELESAIAEQAINQLRPA